MKRGVVEAPMLKTVTTNLEGQCELYTMEGSRLIRHTLKSMPARKVCAYCKFTGERFANGNIKQTFYHCDTCNVPLCRFQSRECFLVYHKLKFQGTSSQGFFILAFGCSLPMQGQNSELYKFISMIQHTQHNAWLFFLFFFFILLFTRADVVTLL